VFKKGINEVRVNSSALDAHLPLSSGGAEERPEDAEKRDDCGMVAQAEER
jgi:hypothetical protein